MQLVGFKDFFLTILNCLFLSLRNFPEWWSVTLPFGTVCFPLFLVNILCFHELSSKTDSFISGNCYPRLLETTPNVDQFPLHTGWNSISTPCTEYAWNKV